MSTISIKAHFAAGHRILGLGGLGEKCRNIHGHTWTVTWTFAQDPTWEFCELKARLKNLIDIYFDHAFILDIRDDFCHYLDVNHLKQYQLEGPPTTEAIAAEIARLTVDRLITEHGKGQKALFPEAKLLRLELGEGPDNCATWEPPQQTAREMFASAGVDFDQAMKGVWAEAIPSP